MLCILEWHLLALCLLTIYIYSGIDHSYNTIHHWTNTWFLLWYILRVTSVWRHVTTLSKRKPCLGLLGISSQLHSQCKPSSLGLTGSSVSPQVSNRCAPTLESSKHLLGVSSLCSTGHLQYLCFQRITAPHSLSVPCHSTSPLHEQDLDMFTVKSNKSLFNKT